MKSLIGSIGSMRKGWGLEEALENVYGPDAFIQMISGRAISKAIGWHFMIEVVLLNKLIMAVLQCKQYEKKHNKLSRFQHVKRKGNF